MLNKKTFCFTTFILIALISNIILLHQTLSLKKSVLNLEKKVTNFDDRLSDFTDREKEVLDGIDKGITLILNGQEDNQREVKNELERINRKTDTQFSKTVSMSKTYDAILEEQKKKTIDTAEKDNAFLEEKNNALSLYKKGDFTSAYTALKKLSEERKEDMECLACKTKSLFYMNRADSSNYSEILENIKILKQNAAADTECLEIEESIICEQEGFNE